MIGTRRALLSSGTSPLLRDLISYWSLEEASGTRLDAHGTNHLTDNNTVTQAVGKVGQAAQFTAANLEYLSIPSNTRLQMGSTDFSLQAWVYLDNKTTYRTFIGKDTTSGAGREYLLVYDQPSDRFILAISNGAGTTVIATASALGSPSTATWYHILGWLDRTTATANIQVNGGTVNSTPTGGLSVNSGSTEFRLGAASAVSLYHNGRQDQTAIWKRILTTAERSWLWNGGSGRSYAEVRAYRG